MVHPIQIQAEQEDRDAEVKQTMQSTAAPAATTNAAERPKIPAEGRVEVAGNLGSCGEIVPLQPLNDWILVVLRTVRTRTL